MGGFLQDALCALSVTHRYSLYHDDWREGAGRATLGHAFEDQGSTFLGSYDSLHWAESISSWHVKTVIGSFVMLVLVRQMYSYWMLRGGNKVFDELSPLNKVVWINRFTSTFHALFSVGGAAYVLLIDDCQGKLWNNPVFGSTPVSGWFIFEVASQPREFFACVSIGYFVYDILDMLVNPGEGKVPQIIHHLCVLGAYWCSTTFHRGGIWVMYSLIMEITTPSLNLRWFMAKYHLKDSRLYFYNGIALTSGFLFFRVILHWIMFWHVWIHFEECTKVARFVLISFLIEMVGVFVLNHYWFSLLMRGAYRILSEDKKSTKAKDE